MLIPIVKTVFEYHQKCKSCGKFSFKKLFFCLLFSEDKLVPSLESTNVQCDSFRAGASHIFLDITHPQTIYVYSRKNSLQRAATNDLMFYGSRGKQAFNLDATYYDGY